MKFSDGETLNVYLRTLSLEDLTKIEFPIPIGSYNDMIKQAESIINELDIPERFLPAWTKTINECLEATSKAETQPVNILNEKLLDPDLPQPFEEILVPFVYYARGQLKAKLLGNYELASGQAHLQFEKGLLTWLSYINSFAMEFEYSIFRSLRQSGLQRAFDSNQKFLSNNYYEDFIKKLCKGDLLDYLSTYPVLAKLMADSVDQWIDTVAEFIIHFKKDRPEIERVFNEGSAIGRIVDVNAFQSDRHKKGRSVITLTCESGLKLVYKPKSIGIEHAYCNLLNWFNSIGSPIKLRAFKVLAFNDYGWAEFVENWLPRNNNEYQSYYKNAGALICIVHVLGATDLHYENIIMNGQNPVLIDLETLLHPFVQNQGYSSDDAYVKAEEVINNSVIRTGLLPRWLMSPNDQAYDVSGLGEFSPQEYSVEKMQWTEVNTDSMRVKKTNVVMSSKERAPHFADHNVSLSYFKNELIEGFRDMYNFLITKKADILVSDYWQNLSRQTLRFVFRATKIYAQVQSNLLNPKFLINGRVQSMGLDVLYRGLIVENIESYLGPLIESEKEHLKDMDIPHFTINSGSNSIYLGEKKILNYFTASGFADATSRLKNLDTKDLNIQVELIKGSLLCRNEIVNHYVDFENDSKEKNGNTFLLTKNMALKKCMSIASILKEKAIFGNDGSVTWIAPKYNYAVKKYQLEPISTDIYSGNAGIGLFFGALYKLYKKNDYREMALSTVQVKLKEMEIGTAPSAGTGVSTGGYEGYGSLVYSFLKIGILTEESRLVDAAKKAASFINSISIDQDKSYDIMHGSAGIILSLLTLHQYCNDDNLVNTSIYAGNHLLKNRKITSCGFRSWKNGDDNFLTGFSHGAAGIAYALLRLYEVTGAIAYKEAASEAIAYESSVFNNTENNWPDFRKSAEVEDNNNESRYMCTWCNGATGIGLARLAGLDILDTEVIRNDIEVSLTTSKKYLSSSSDHVCCGNFGRLELLLSASLKLSDEQLLKYTLRKAGELINLTEINGDFRYNPYIGFTPGFFQGISGIGYQILRLVYPNMLPSILTLN